MRYSNKLFLFLLFSSILITIISLSFPIINAQPDNNNNELTIIFPDVGQGDSILIIFPNQKTMLIDGGERDQSDTILSLLTEYNIEKIDSVVATHPHADHIGGLLGIVQNIPIGKIYDSGQEHNTQTFENYLDLIESKRIPFSLARENNEIDDLDSKVDIKILNPPEPLFTGTRNDINDNSIVLKLTYGNFSILLTGDIGEIPEERLVNNTNIKDIDILKVPHHGSKYSSTKEFLYSVNPQIAVILVGENNRYGHPHLETLERLNNHESIQHIFRTDIDGTIILITDGNQFAMKSLDTNEIIYHILN
ncbi:MAG TPA: ComEC/Rec2 family competence protein [Nitrososphaeraceae archaeon]|nr:ComEC/Rec2 family competence protein [Nitrososphaeraceae archaeon]